MTSQLNWTNAWRHNGEQETKTPKSSKQTERIIRLLQRIGLESDGEASVNE